MTLISMPLLDAKRLAWALLPHISRDPITPVLTHAAIMAGAEGGVFGYSSDRYTVGRYDLTNIVEEPPTETFLLPRAVLSSVAGLGPATLPRSLSQYRVEFERFKGAANFEYVSATVIWQVEDEMEDTHWMRKWDVVSGAANFPPVANLFDEFLQGDNTRTHLGGEHLQKFAGYAKIDGGHMRVTLADKGDRLKPHLIEIGTRFKGLIQPYQFTTEYGTDLAAENAKRESEKGEAVTENG